MIFLHVIFIIMAVYGLYFYIQGCQEMTKEVRQSWAPQDIETWQAERDQERYFGQIILMFVAMYVIVLLHI